MQNAGTMASAVASLKLINSRHRENWKKAFQKIDICKDEESADNKMSVDDCPNVPYVNRYHRDDICQWIYQLGNQMDLGPDVFCLCFQLIDRMLSILKVQTRHIQVLGAACLSLATKFTEDEHRKHFSKFLLQQANLSFSMRDLNKMEVVVCNKLDWQFQEVGPLDYFYSVTEVLNENIPKKHKDIAAHFLVSKLTNFDLARLGSLEIAVGCVISMLGGRKGESHLRTLFRVNNISVDFKLAKEAVRLIRPGLAKLKLSTRGVEAECGDGIHLLLRKYMATGCLRTTPYGQKTFADIVRDD